MPRLVKPAAVVVAALAIGVGCWALGRASVHRTAPPKMRPAPAWLRSKFSLESPSIPGYPERGIDSTKPNAHWIIDGTDPKRGTVLLQPDSDDGCVLFAAHAVRSPERVRVVVKQQKPPKIDPYCQSIIQSRYGLPFEVEMPLDGRPISGPGYEARPPARWFTFRSRAGRVVTIPSVVGLSLRQARDVLARTGHPVTPQSPDGPAENLVVTAQSVPGWAILPVGDHTQIALTTAAR